MMARRESGYAAEELTKARITSRWFGILGPLAAAFAQQQVSYGFTTWACTHHMSLVLHVPALLALAVAALGAVLSNREYHRREDGTTEEEHADYGSTRFFGVTGLAMSGLAAALILAQWLPTLFIHPCQR